MMIYSYLSYQVRAALSQVYLEKLKHYSAQIQAAACLALVWGLQWFGVPGFCAQR